MKHTLTPPHGIGLLAPSCPVRPLAVVGLPSARFGGWLFAAALALGVHAQAFDSGSNGSYGALEITANTTLEMPSDGVFHCTTITVASGTTLRFTPNARNTPVTLLATGDVVIGGTINISGSNGTPLQGGFGGPGGFAGGNPSRADLPPSAGSGPGGGPTNVNTSVRHAVFAARPDNAPADLAEPYGNALLIPMIGGSGGGGSPGDGGGGGGGGAILIASSTLIRVEGTGRILAEGGYNGGSAIRSIGSGGAIRLVAPKVMGLRPLGSVEAVLSVRSADSNNAYHGRIRIDSIDRTALDFWFQPAAAASIGSFMTLQPSPLPRLDLVRAAGVDIAPDAGPVYLELPFGSPAAQEVEVQARDFRALVPIRVRLVPEAGAAVEYSLELDNRTENPVRGSVTVDVPANVRTAVEVWTATMR
ncbi:MAG: hypothetical protein KJ072_22105 [Verrucomicrobia bacterium]|nr:hypothetical protein [Verrucomicrobiota bacterium]